jgi:hypothetical protein
MRRWHAISTDPPPLHSVFICVDEVMAADPEQQARFLSGRQSMNDNDDMRLLWHLASNLMMW